MKFKTVALIAVLTLTSISYAQTPTPAASPTTPTAAAPELPLDHQQLDLQAEYDKLQAQATTLDLILGNLTEYKQLKAINAQLTDLNKRNELLQNKKQEAAQKAQLAANQAAQKNKSQAPPKK